MADEDSIGQTFASFGEVEFMQIIKNGNDAFMHITFERSRDLYFAYLHYQSIGDDDKIEIARMDQQPDQLRKITDLPNECLSHVFKYCDVPTQSVLLSTCTRFRAILVQMLLTEKKVREFKRDSLGEGIKIARNILRSCKVTAYILKAEYDNRYKKTSNNISIDFNTTQKILEIDLGMLNEHYHLFKQFSNEIEILRLQNILISDERIGKNLKFPRAISIEFVGVSGLLQIPQIESLEGMPKLKTLRFAKVMFHPDVEFQQCFERTEIKEIVFSKCVLRNFSKFLETAFEVRNRNKLMPKIILEGTKAFPYGNVGEVRISSFKIKMSKLIFFFPFFVSDRTSIQLYTDFKLNYHFAVSK